MAKPQENKSKGPKACKPTAKISPTEACREVAKALSAAYPELAADKNSPLNWAIKVLTAAAEDAK